ncbi:MAG TPA: YcxB family protein [Actinocrinis sp.]|jgi:hypothetical protein
MATVLKFDLSADDVERIMTVPGSARKVGICAGILGAIGVVGVADGAATSTSAPVVSGVVALALAVVFAALLWQLPRTRAAMAARLTGPATLKLTDAGVQYKGAGLGEDFAWNKVSVINDRPGGWVLSVRKVGAFIIPKTAVSANQTQDFSSQLRTWAGGRYRIRRR